VEINEALTVLLEEAVRMRRALQYYANKNNYLDGVPMFKDDDGVLITDDEGAMARQGLRLVDVSLGVIVKPITATPYEEGT